MTIAENFQTFLVDQDWQANWPEDNTIFMYRGKRYDHERQKTLVVFERLGLPVPNRPTTKIIFVDERGFDE